jgi:maltose operon protein
MKKQSYIVSVLSLILTACSSSPSPTQIVEAPNCERFCDLNYGQYPYVQLSDNEKFKLDIDSNSPVAAFESGNSHFAAFKLSERSAETQLTLSALMINDSVFAPEIALLDGDHQMVNRYSLDEFDILPSDAFTRTRYVKRLSINGEETPYIIVYTRASELGKTIQVEHPARRRAREFGEVMPMVTDPKYVHQPTGEIELEVKSLKMRPIRAFESVSEPIAASLSSNIAVQPDTQAYYFEAINLAVENGNLDKALALLQEAKLLNIEGVQEVFVKAVEGSRQ